jgi:RNA polymerase sigma factor (sigma-70 family)
MTDPLISEYLPVIRGHITKKYSWVDGTGNCMLTVDDLIQVASIALVRLVDRWDGFLARDGKEREGNGGLFWNFLENEVKNDIAKYYRDVVKLDRPTSDSLDAVPQDADESLATIRTALNARRDGESWGMVNDDLVDHFSVMPQRDKILIALRYFDELPFARIADVLGANEKTTRNLTLNAVNRWRAFSRNQYVEYPTDLPRRLPQPWEPTETLTTYLQSRHRKDISEYLGYVTICFRNDVSYLVDILGSERTVAPGAKAVGLSPAQQHQVDELMAQSVNMVEISRRLGVSYGLVIGHARRRRAA